MAKKKNLKIKTERFMTNVIVVMISQILIKLVGLVYKIYLTKKDLEMLVMQFMVVVIKFMHYFY